MTTLSADAVAAPDAIDPALVDPALAAAAVADTDANAAASSTVDDTDAKAPSLLDVVKSAIEPKVEPTDPSTVDAGEVVPPVEDPAAVVAEPEAKDDADLPFHNHPRWKEVQSERDSFRDDAGQYGKITEFMNEHGLTPENVAEGYQIMALLKSGSPEDLSKAREYFHTNLQALDSALGNVLPDDLQTRVEDGLLDETSAQELARARASAVLRDTQAATRETATADAKAASDAKALGASMVTAVSGWEERAKATDPDYARKAELIETTCRAIVQREGKSPQSPEEAVALADKALAEVNGHFKALMPKPKPISLTPLSSSTPTNAAPKTFAEACASAVNYG